MEKHWKSVIHRSICDYFFEAQGKCNRPEDIPTVISAPHHKLVLIYRNKLYFIAVVVNEVSPLFVVEILHRAVDIFEEYFGECNETSLKENFVVVYEVEKLIIFVAQLYNVRWEKIKFFFAMGDASTLCLSVRHSGSYLDVG